MGEPTDYVHDVFVSYQRKRWGDWVRKYLVRHVDRHLEGALGRKPIIFVDQALNAGAMWPTELREAVACSRCMLAVWSPSYFQSEWCRYECQAILARSAGRNSSCSLVPIVVSDGESFPPYAKCIQHVDCTDYAYDGEGFEGSGDYYRFQKLVKEACVGIARVIRAAPKWEKGWLTSEAGELPAAPDPVVPPPFIG